MPFVPGILVSLSPDSSICVPIGFWSESWLVWIPLIVGDTVAFILALAKGYEYMAQRRNIGWLRSSLMDRLIRDSIFYYIMWAYV